MHPRVCCPPGEHELRRLHRPSYAPKALFQVQHMIRYSSRNPSATYITQNSTTDGCTRAQLHCAIRIDLAPSNQWWLPTYRGTSSPFSIRM
ncbi:hypothetical protein V6N11_082003 [Hibiscus sabdariffa]